MAEPNVRSRRDSIPYGYTRFKTKVIRDKSCVGTPHQLPTVFLQRVPVNIIALISVVASGIARLGANSLFTPNP